jgi:hypothetical protein
MKRTRIFRLVAIATVVAGVAYVASKEENRAKLVQSSKTAGEYLSNGWQFANQWVASFRSQDEATFYPYTQQPHVLNGVQHSSEATHSR